jgi:hypothetical protein
MCDGHSVSHGNYFILAKNVTTWETRYIKSEGTWPVLVNVTIRWGICKEATGRTHANMHFESCFTVLWHKKVNIKQRLQH